MHLLFVERFDSIDAESGFVSLSSVEFYGKIRITGGFKHNSDLIYRGQVAKVEFFRAIRP